MMIFPVYKHSIACHYEDPRRRCKRKGCMQDVNVMSLAGASALMNNVKLMSYVQRLRSLLQESLPTRNVCTTSIWHIFPIHKEGSVHFAKCASVTTLYEHNVWTDWNFPTGMSSKMKSILNIFLLINNPEIHAEMSEIAAINGIDNFVQSIFQLLSVFVCLFVCFSFCFFLFFFSSHPGAALK